jgi:O-antigen ligase
VFASLYVLWAGVTTFWSIDPDASRTRLVTCLQLLILVWLIWEIAWSPERQRSLLQAYVLGVCVAALATIHSYLSGAVLLSDGMFETGRFVALNQDPNELGVILALGLPMAWYLGLAQPQRTTWLWRLYLPLGITAILLTASRGAFLTALVALVIIPWTLARLHFRTKIALYALAVGSLMLATAFVPEASLERIRSTRADIEAGYFGGRIYVWMAGLEVASQHPLAGVGAGGFGAAVAPTLHTDMASHQTFLEILVEQGIVGFFLFLATIAAIMTPLRHLPPLERRLGIVLLAALAVGSMSVHLGHEKQSWFVMGLLAAQVARRPARTPDRQPLTMRVGRGPLPR